MTTTVDDALISKILLRAAELQEMYGLSRDTFADEQGRICLLEAINLAGRELLLDAEGQPRPEYGPTMPDVRLRLVNAIHAHIGCTRAISDWSDTWCDDAAEAAAMLRYAAEH